MDGQTSPVDFDLSWVEPQIACARLGDAPGIVLMLGSDQVSGRYSYLTAFPAFTIVDDDPQTGFDRLRENFWRSDTEVGEGFSGGYAGLLGYDLGQAFERVPRLHHPGNQWPAVAMGWYDAVIVFDHVAKSVEVRGKEPAKSRLLDALCALPRPLEAGAGRVLQVWEDERYCSSVETAKAYIRAGDVFQLNLSHRFEASLTGHDVPQALIRKLAETSPASYSAYYQISPDLAVVTNSPERFVSLSSGGLVETRPIKGTAPRLSALDEDQASGERLSRSVKDRAENLMIVDLMRNDLSRVCQPGSVVTPELFALESFSNVHHLVSTVRGQLRDDCDVFDLMAAGFPAGSITGAPKLRAMEIIAELEAESRGPYCGALGWIGANGAADFNVMIRTLACSRSGPDWRIEMRSGGAITIDSDPQAELAETHAKAKTLKAVIESL
jgi:para-aminobenzoate synthetase component 1